MEPYIYPLPWEPVWEPLVSKNPQISVWSLTSTHCPGNLFGNHWSKRTPRSRYGALDLPTALGTCLGTTGLKEPPDLGMEPYIYPLPWEPVWEPLVSKNPQISVWSLRSTHCPGNLFGNHWSQRTPRSRHGALHLPTALGTCLGTTGLKEPPDLGMEP